MMCEVKNCLSNEDGYCIDSSYVSIDENGECDRMPTIEAEKGKQMVKYDVIAMLPDGEIMKPRVIGTFDNFVNADIFKRAYEYYYYSIMDSYYDKKKVKIVTKKDG